MALKKCTKENCEICQESGWHIQLKQINDGMLWKNGIYTLIELFVLVLFMGWWGIPMWFLLIYLMSANGGGVLSYFETEWPKANGCVAGRENCPICHNKNV